MKQCHKCEYYGKNDEHCLECQMPETYYIPNIYFDEQKERAVDSARLLDESGLEPVTGLPQDVEDLFKLRLIDIFQLSPTELLCLQAIMQNKTLSGFAEDIEKFSRGIKTFSRHRAFQTRNAILAKLPWMANALLTKGQRKKLTVNSNRRKRGKTNDKKSS